MVVVEGSLFYLALSKVISDGTVVYTGVYLMRTGWAVVFYSTGTGRKAQRGAHCRVRAGRRGSAYTTPQLFIPRPPCIYQYIIGHL